MLSVDMLENFGVDTKEGLNRCMNNEGFYLRMINLGLSNEYFDTLGKAIEEGNLEEAFEAAHALKGVIGNLALTPIYDPLADMTEMLRAKKQADYIVVYRPIKEKRDKLLAMLKG